MNVVIVESPSKAKTINKYLGNDFTVLASFGHVRDLPSKNGSVDPDNNFAMHYQVSKDSEKHIKEITKAVKQADKVYLATDPDREGEAISWHVLEELKTRIKDIGQKEVLRVEFHEVTKTAILNAMANPRPLAIDLINAQQARRALDYLVGFNLSPVLWRKVKGGLSAGRVQSVALRLICERETEIEAFNPQEYWSIEADFNTPENQNLTARLYQFSGNKVEKFSFTSEAEATAAVQALENGSYSITDITKKQVKRNPQPPFITSTLQMEASRKLGFGARRTMQVAQKLYEGVNIGGETTGLITYMRTDSVNLASEAIQALRGTIEHQFGAEYVPEKPNYYKTKSQNAQEAHEAIRPTNPQHTPAAMRQYLDDDMFKLYDLIWKRTMACQMAQARLDQTALTIGEAGGQHSFRASGSIITFPGFLKAYKQGLDDNEQDDTAENMLPAVKENDAMSMRELKPEQHFTEPPPRYSEATLVKALEEYGIGRPSTYATIVGTIRDRGYVRLDAKRFHPEDIGRVVNRLLTDHFSQYVNVDFTAHMEDDLDAVSRGEKEWLPMMADFWTPFKELVDDKIKTVKKSDYTSEMTDEICPKCKKGHLVIRLGRYGKFKGCSNFPECDYIENMDGTTKEEQEAAKAEQMKANDTGILCPKCGQHNIVKKVSRRGKEFYGCAGYPKCDYAVWNKPVVEDCPDKCGATVITVKETKQGDFKVCPDCGWFDPELPPRYRPRKKKTADDSTGAETKTPAKKKAAPKKKAATTKAKTATAKKPAAKKKAAAKPKADKE